MCNLSFLLRRAELLYCITSQPVCSDKPPHIRSLRKDGTSREVKHFAGTTNTFVLIYLAHTYSQRSFCSALVCSHVRFFKFSGVAQTGQPLSRICSAKHTCQGYNVAFIGNDLWPRKLSGPMCTSKRPVAAAVPAWAAYSEHRWCPFGCGCWQSIFPRFFFFFRFSLIFFQESFHLCRFISRLQSPQSRKLGLCALLYLEREWRWPCGNLKHFIRSTIISFRGKRICKGKE